MCQMTTVPKIHRENCITWLKPCIVHCLVCWRTRVWLDIGVIGYEIFTMLMVMAIATTLMTTPMLALCVRGRRGAAAMPAG